MKHFFIGLLAAVALIAVFSCKKESQPSAPPDHIKTDYRVILFGSHSDSIISTVMTARMETVGLIVAEDSKLRAVVTAYDGHGKFTIEVTNKQPCQVILRWGWDGQLLVDSLTNTDSTNGTPQSDVLKANQVKVYQVYSNAKVGRIKLQAQGVDCGNSSTLIINITMDILPVKLISNSATYDKIKGVTYVNFTVDDPTIYDWILVQRMNDQKVWVQATLIANDFKTKNYSIPL
jgi:hypothetical protein